MMSNRQKWKEQKSQFTFDEVRDGGELLELEEGALEHVLGVDLLDAQQVQHHVVRQVEGRVHGVGLALDQVAAHVRRHLLVDHQNDDALVVQAAPARSARHLDVLARRDLPAHRPSAKHTSQRSIFDEKLSGGFETRS